MAIFLSVLNLALAVLFVYAGTRKAFRPIAELAPKMPWVNKFSERNVRLIGYAELAGGLGLVLPGVVGLGFIQLIAASCLAVLMVGAAAWHLKVKDNKGAIPAGVIALALILIIFLGY